MTDLKEELIKRSFKFESLSDMYYSRISEARDQALLKQINTDTVLINIDNVLTYCEPFGIRYEHIFDKDSYETFGAKICGLHIERVSLGNDLKNIDFILCNGYYPNHKMTYEEAVDKIETLEKRVKQLKMNIRNLSNTIKILSKEKEEI